MNKILKRLLTGVLTLATVFTALPTTAVHAAETQYWTESEERVGIVEKVMNDGSMMAMEEWQDYGIQRFWLNGNQCLNIFL